MQTKYFSPSVNIKRDKGHALHYIPTRNGELAFQKITSSFRNGTKAFNIIGAYGSGKSSFILALEQVLNNEESYFVNPFKDEIKSFDTSFLIGEFVSFKNAFCDSFGVNSTSVFEELKTRFNSGLNSGKGHLIVIDEFGKFLEYAAKESPEEELYFIQQLAEFVNTPELPVLLVTTLHQPFEDYALSLDKAQRQEWDKVKGRLVEISFNEPVEQLLFLAAERINGNSINGRICEKDQLRLFESIQQADVFPLKDYFSFDFAQKLFPFDILSASIATIAFQRYGQNERSLFTFLESNDYMGINDFVDGDEYYHIPRLYKYLKYNFHTLLHSRFNPDSAKWKVLDEAIQRTEASSIENVENALDIVTTIGLNSILGRKGQKISGEFLESYCSIALKIDNPARIIDQLETKKIIRYRNFSHSYVLFKGTDFDINTELDESANQVSKDFSIIHNLQKHFSFPIIPAKRISYERGTPRYFVYELTENILNKEPEGDIDGYINLIFNDLVDIDKVKARTENENRAVIYGCYKENKKLKKLLLEIDKINITKSRCLDDYVALNELDTYLETVINEMNQIFQSSFFGPDSTVNWVFNGEIKSFSNAREFNKFLSQICEKVYPDTPKFKNELINREKPSGTISHAKKTLIGHLLNNSLDEGLGFEENRFPPEKTIYQTLFQSTGIHKFCGDKWVWGAPDSASFSPLWEISEGFLADCAVSPRKLDEFIAILRHKPLKLKQGFIEFWVPFFLIAKQKEIAFYEGNVFIPSLSDDTIEVAMRQPQKYRISTYQLDENRLRIFNRYRFFLNQIESEAPDSDTFIETVKPFLGFYQRLVSYTKQTKSISPNAQRLRDAISQAEDPERIFFEDIPSALGFILKDFEDDSKIENFSLALQSATREISGALSNLVNRVESVINIEIKGEKINFPENKLLIQKRYKKLNVDRLETKQKSLYQRINSPLDDRQSWIASIAFAIIGKSLDQFTDSDERNFKSLFPKRVHELDNLTELSKKDIDKENEEVLKLEITSFVDGVQNNLVRLSKKKSKEIEQLEGKIRPLLKKDDKQANIALLIKLLQKEIGDE